MYLNLYEKMQAKLTILKHVCDSPTFIFLAGKIAEFQKYN